MANSSMDTDALLGMSLDDLIASKSSGRGSKTKTRSQGTGAGGFGGGGGGGGGGGKMRSTGRATRRQQSAPYANPVPKHARGGSNTRVYVGNLAWSVTWRELKDLMKTAGKVVKADVGVDSTGRSRVSHQRAKLCFNILCLEHTIVLDCPPYVASRSGLDSIALNAQRTRRYLYNYCTCTTINIIYHKILRYYLIL